MIRIVTALFLLSVLAGCASLRPSSSDLLDVQGHRGARGVLPENSVAGFLYALDAGVRTLELDVVISADSQVVVSHEPWMHSDICTHPSGRPVSPQEERSINLFRMTAQESAAYDCGSRQHPRFPEQQPQPASKPLLFDVIRQADAYARANRRPLPHYNIETKSRIEWEGVHVPDPETFVRLVVDVIRETGIERRALVQSFDVRTLVESRKLAPELPIALLIAPEGLPNEALPPLPAVFAFVGLQPDVFSPEWRLLSPETVRQAQAMGMRVIPWTVNRAEDIETVLSWGVDGIITDYPERVPLRHRAPFLPRRR